MPKRAVSRTLSPQPKKPKPRRRKRINLTLRPGTQNYSKPTTVPQSPTTKAPERMAAPNPATPAGLLTPRRQMLLICLLLALITAAAYWPVTTNGFINYDDQDYVTANPHVQAGLTLDSFRWAFTAMFSSNWHPLTWLSHMLDCQLYGLNPLGHHLTNLLFHIANSMLLFLLLKRMTGAIWRSTLVAGL